MKAIIDLFRIRKDERLLALSSAIVFITLNTLVVMKYFDVFSKFHKFYWPVFIHRFHVSGFDPITYYVVTEWGTSYNVYRHPLLAFFMYPLYLINKGLMWLTGMNCVQLIVATLLVAAVVYAVVFTYRIMREIVGVSRTDATLLSAFLFSFAYVMVAFTVPDHFALSMLMLLITLYVVGVRMKKGKGLTGVQTLLLFVFTAGISLSNGIKVFLAGLFSRGKRFFRWRYFIVAVIIPSAIIWAGARLEYDKMVYPEWHAKKVANEKKIAEARKKGIKETPGERIQKQRSAVVSAHSGKPIKEGEFWEWTDMTTQRMPTIIENLFGESLQLHSDHLLEDTLTGRPVVVKYNNPISYVIEGLTLLLFFAGLWYGRNKRFLWTAMSFFFFDMLLHLGIGFGINEVYIMTPHWAYVIPIAVAYVMLNAPKRIVSCARCLLLFLTVYLWASNGWLYASYLL